MRDLKVIKIYGLMEGLTQKISVHIADDHQIIIDGLIALLEPENDIDIVGYSLNGEEALDWFQKHTADVLLLDLNMPKIGGMEVLNHFQKRETIAYPGSVLDEIGFVQPSKDS